MLLEFDRRHIRTRHRGGIVFCLVSGKLPPRTRRREGKRKYRDLVEVGAHSDETGLLMDCQAPRGDAHRFVKEGLDASRCEGRAARVALNVLSNQMCVVGYHV